MALGVDAGTRAWLGLGGGSSPVVAAAPTAAPPSPGVAAFGAGTTGMGTSPANLAGTSPGHLAPMFGIAAFVLLIVIRHSLPR